MQPFELNPTFCFTLLGTLFIYLWTRPPRWSLVSILILAALLRLLCQRSMGGLGNYFGVRWISWGAFLGIATLLVLACRAISSRSADKRSCMQTFYAGSNFPLLALLDGYSVPLNIWLRPKTYDAFLLRFDGSLGFQPSFVLGHRLLQNPTLWNVTTVVYYALPFAVSLVYASDRVRIRKPVAILLLFLGITIVGFAQYGVYPAVGPRHAFARSYPDKPPQMAQIVLQPMSVPDSPRNCVPSLHFGGALPVWWNTRQWPVWGRGLAALFLRATAFATLALGEHYLADLIVAIPFALIFQSGCTISVPWSERMRWHPICIAVLLTILWMLLLRFGVNWFEISRLLPWTLILVTVVWSIVLERRLSTAAAGAIRSRLPDRA